MNSTVEAYTSMAGETMAKDMEDMDYSDSGYVVTDDADFVGEYDEGFDSSEMVDDVEDVADTEEVVSEVPEDFADSELAESEIVEDVVDPEEVEKIADEEVVDPKDEEYVECPEEPESPLPSPDVEEAGADEIYSLEHSQLIDESEIITQGSDVAKHDHEDHVESSEEEHEEPAGTELPESKAKKDHVVKTKKLQWEAKPSVPAYVINTANKFNVEDLEKIVITTKGKAAKMAASKIEKMSTRARESTQRLKEAMQTTKMTQQTQREEVVAAEKARVNAAKKAREVQAERIRQEAAERRKVELLEKQRLQEEYEAKKAALTKARREALSKSRA
ncbi:hypothetical protein BBOV_I003380 [Babesia bovis T2Bo]|uniref:Uncharacterized protein n=1 Tax=Babesia bovis TaxID=5865 RepID=A7AWJ2_BABBO|nr:hypothetical protein BBOV_I003380 [Babesia bovis T2Bo]EDO05420.1 hypothetical protein BBOV_I003380 [Babesia bovis T2Bo]|eukprot:XP_001608988.1 hypothetical protein [Babesia bovis T2Bo]